MRETAQLNMKFLSRDNVEKTGYLRDNKTLGILLLRTLRKVAALKPY